MIQLTRVRQLGTGSATGNWVQRQQMSLLTWWRNRRRPKRALGCVETNCKVEGSRWGCWTHGRCQSCSAWTCNTALWVDPVSLRRQVLPTCSLDVCRTAAYDSRSRSRRTKFDWTQPELPDQFPSKGRTAVKVFLGEPAISWAFTSSNAGDLNQVIGTLGLHGDLYAEERSRQTVLRRLEKGRPV